MEDVSGSQSGAVHVPCFRTMHSALKEKLRDLLLGSGPVPQLSPVGRRSPQDEVRVFLRGLDTPLDVTHSNVVASLRPLTIGVGIRGGQALRESKWRRLTLDFRQCDGSSKLLGRIDLRVDGSIPLEEGALLLCRCGRSRNYCTTPARFYMQELYHYYGRFRSRAHGDPYNFKMSAPELRRLFVFYIWGIYLTQVTPTSCGRQKQHFQCRR